MPYIYEPKGRAGEYGKWALNHYKSCGHFCKYCFVPAVTYQTPEEFHRDPKPRKIDFKALNRELESLSGQTVFLSFLSDPYQPIDTELKFTREIIQRLQLFGVSVNVLTKGGLRSVRDFDLLAKDPKSLYGGTLTFLDEALSLQWEPGAALPQDRITALKEAHSLGIHTWVSLEPVISPEQSLELIHQTKDFVDEYKIGKWNHDPEAAKVAWKNFALAAVGLCERLGKKYYLKKDLQAYLK